MKSLPIPVLILSSWLISSCGGGSLEDRGRELGAKNCECEGIDWRYDADAAEAVLDAMKADASLRWDSAEALGRYFRDEHREEKDRLEEACDKEFKEMAAQLAIDFPKDEDRKTLENLLDAMRQQCKQRHRTEREELEKALQEARERARLSLAPVVRTRIVEEHGAPAIHAHDADLPVSVDLSASRVKWIGTMLGIKSHHGTVNLSSATINVMGNAVTGGSFVVDMKSITPLDAQYAPEGSGKGTKSQLIGHLFSPDFFDVDKHPSAHFEIGRVTGNTANGFLTVRGIRHQERVSDITVDRTGNRVTISGKLTFDRQQYGVAWSSGAKDVVLNNDIQLEITLFGTVNT